jgi:outer membrane murein-binding lipoprotein Lpp
MIKFLERFFRKKEPLRIERKNLDSFINSKLENSEIKLFSKEFLEQLNEHINNISEKCKELENAELQNKNIPSRAITIMQGNRKAYIQKTIQFTDKIKRIVEGIDQTNDSEKILGKISEMKYLLEEYTKATQKPYFVLQEFFANESKNIASEIKQINDLFEKLEKKIKNSDTHKFQEVSLLIEKIKNLDEKNSKLHKEKKTLEKSLIEEEKKINGLNKEINKIKNSDEFKKLSNIQEELGEARAQKKQLSDEINYKISPVSRALRKFAKISLDEDKVNFLISEPFNAVKNIETEKLADLFLDLRKNIQNENLGLKKKVRGKYLSIISEFDKKFIENFKGRIRTLNSKIKELSSEINKSRIWKNIEDLNSRVEKIEKSAEQIKREVSICNENISKINTKDINAKIKEILESMDIELTK